jgi:uncharacterized protein (TIGR02246 family)
MRRGAIMTNIQNVGTDVKAIKGFVQSFDAAWNARDAEQFSTFFTDDTDMHFITLGMRMRDKGELVGSYKKIFSELPANVKHMTKIKEIHTIAPGVLFLDGVTNIIAGDAPGGEVVLRKHTGATILLRTQNGWRIRLMRIWSEPGAAKLKENKNH